MSTIAFWKPYGVLTKFTDPESRPTLADWITEPDLYPAGRLDKDSEGLLVLSSDPRLRGKLTASRHPRTYLVQVEGDIGAAALARLEAGVDVHGHRTAPAEARLIDPPAWLGPRIPPIRVRRHIPDRWIELTLREGRNRQVRKMTAAVGHPTLRLVRWSIGPITLDGLEAGEWRRLRRDEFDALQQALE
ncbi:MAG: pseudouridine synthase [Acidimicrobiia bacterium]